LEYWACYSDSHPLGRDSKCSTYHQWCAFCTKRALVTHSPYILPRYMFLDLPAAWHALDFVPTLNELKPTWTHKTSPTCDLCNAHDVQDEQHLLFPVHPSTNGSSPQYLCVSVSSHRLPHCLLFLAITSTSFIYSFMHSLLIVSRLAVALLN